MLAIIQQRNSVAEGLHKKQNEGHAVGIINQLHQPFQANVAGLPQVRNGQQPCHARRRRMAKKYC